MSNDYRCTDYCPTYNNFQRKHRIYIRNFINRHPTAENHYSIINDQSSEEFSKFRKLFNCKCVYCGVSDEINQEFEIDHFKCRENEGLDHIDNLLYSCKKCNRAKSKHHFSTEYEQILMPITNIQNIFVRNFDYSITIKTQYNQDNAIIDFYNDIKFSDDVRRLDYLLMNLIGLRKKVRNDNISQKLSDCVCTLILKRNQILHNSED